VPGTRPRVIAHRGSSHEAAEHTLGAYEKAIVEGADGLECDIRLTRDGHLVCVHDRRLERTSDGRGPVSTRALVDLQSLDFAGWKNDLPDTADALVSTELIRPPPIVDPPGRVLTLENLLELVISVDRPIELYIETKHPTRWGPEVERRLVELLGRFGAIGRRPDDGWSVVMMSDAPLAVRRFQLRAPAVPTVLVLNRLPPRIQGGRLPYGIGITGPGIHLLRARPDYIAAARQAGKSIYCWVADEPDDIDFLLDHGVDMIATNRPATVIAHLESR
jgi:glycerophosphoryl diester phosphodiesterase